MHARDSSGTLRVWVTCVCVGTCVCDGVLRIRQPCPNDKTTSNEGIEKDSSMFDGFEQPSGGYQINAGAAGETAGGEEATALLVAVWSACMRARA